MANKNKQKNNPDSNKSNKDEQLTDAASPETADEPTNPSISDEVSSNTSDEPNVSSKNASQEQESIAPEISDVRSSDSSDSPEMVLKHNEKEPKSSGSILFLILLVLIALGFGGWNTYEQYNTQQSLNEQLTKQDNIIQSQVALVESLRSDLSKQTQDLSNTKSQLEQTESTSNLLRQQLAATQDKLRVLSSQGKQEWLIEQAHYYLKLAEQKIAFENSISVATALVAQAEDTLKGVTDLQLANLRQAISDDITYLASIPEHDLSPILLKLTSLENLSMNLEPQTLILPKKEELKEEQHKEWFDELMVTLEDFSDKAFKYHPYDEKVPPLLTPNQKSVLRATLQLIITQAQTAALEENKEYFESRLTAASELITQYFANNELSKQMLNEIEALKEERLNKKISYELRALPIIEELREQRRLQWFTDQKSSVNNEEDQP
ncbi:uroporphyrinogen-III C-methyltransferase [Pleionea sediminis]|uniref:uroporphyrinogen-III C-methyltransferase n=1 Tax=Pleionea sediminis TaxID=2569479 RepID=UPI001184E04A|nr:uroporphyrinogen-III C-methyltransferase [Pleionea sediminis]